jgi:hypothetical protein
MRLGVGALVALVWAALDPAVAKAGCPSVCDLGPPSFTITPPVSCAQTRLLPSDCDCGVILQVDSQCGAPIDAKDFSFDSCWLLADRTKSRSPCSSVLIGERGLLTFPIDSNGHKEWVVHMSGGDGDHEARVAIDVSSYNKGGCSCSTAAAASRTAPKRGVALFMLSIACALVARRPFRP